MDEYTLKAGEHDVSQRTLEHSSIVMTTEYQLSDKQYRRDLIKAALTGLLATGLCRDIGWSRDDIAVEAIKQADAVLAADNV